MEKNIETLATALYVKIDDMLTDEPGLAPWRPEGSIPVTASDSELLTMAVMSALPGFRSERRWLRYCGGELRHLFPRQVGQSGYSKRIRKMIFLLMAVIRRLAADTSLWTDDVWIVDSTPVQCGCSRETVKRSDAAGWAEYGYCASHSRYFWGLRLHLVCTLQGLPVMFAVAGAKACEREVLLGMLEIDAALVAARPGQTLIGDQNYFGRLFEQAIADSDLALLRPVRKGEARRAGQQYLKPLRQVIESVNQTLKGQPVLHRRVRDAQQCAQPAEHRQPAGQPAGRPADQRQRAPHAVEGDVDADPGHDRPGRAGPGRARRRTRAAARLERHQAAPGCKPVSELNGVATVITNRALPGRLVSPSGGRLAQ